MPKGLPSFIPPHSSQLLLIAWMLGKEEEEEGEGEEGGGMERGRRERKETDKRKGRKRRNRKLQENIYLKGSY